ncbi:unnamed protein product [Zymoseptoria tritici ST99CH_3D1]|nr:unnamed protein product [Zymoseptoria tritici ST99CH_3D1]
MLRQLFIIASLWLGAYGDDNCMIAEAIATTAPAAVSTTTDNHAASGTTATATIMVERTPGDVAATMSAIATRELSTTRAITTVLVMRHLRSCLHFPDPRLDVRVLRPWNHWTFRACDTRARRYRDPGMQEMEMQNEGVENGLKWNG